MEIVNWKQVLLPYQQVVDELIVKFTGIQREFKIKGVHSPIENVEGRVKSIASIMDKANKRNIPLENALNKLEDIAGIRIICRFVEDIYKVVSIIKKRNDYDLNVIQEEDYIANTKKSGYRSYHITINYPIFTSDGKMDIKAEIQIRTLAMNFWATIEHSLRYKYNGNMPDELKERLQACASAAFALDTEMTTIRHELLEAQRIVETKRNLVDEILKNIQNLYFNAKYESVNEANMDFIELYQRGNIEELLAFNKELKTIAQLYKVEYV